MRNLLQYPVTEKEIVDCLRSIAAEKMREERIGDMRATLLDCAAEIVETAYDMLRGIEKRFKDNPDSVLKYCTPWDKATDLIRACHPETKKTL